MEDKYNLQSVDNALRLIEVLDQVPNEMGVTEISRALSLGKSTVHRLIATMLNREFIIKNDLTGKYTLGYKIVTIANNLLEKLDIITVTRPILENLVEETGETCHLVAYSNQIVTVIERFHSIYDNKKKYNVGTALPAYTTACGKAILAYLPKNQLKTFFEKAEFYSYTPFSITDKNKLIDELSEGKERGYFEEQQENEEGRACFGVPIFNKENKIIAAISLTGPVSRMNDKREMLINKLRIAAYDCTEIYKNYSLLPNNG